MSLRRKDDWDDAVEEAARNAGWPPVVASHGYDYGKSVCFTAEELGVYRHVVYGYTLVVTPTPDGGRSIKVERIG